MCLRFKYHNSFEYHKKLRVKSDALSVKRCLKCQIKTNLLSIERTFKLRCVFVTKYHNSFEYHKKLRVKSDALSVKRCLKCQIKTIGCQLKDIQVKVIKSQSFWQSDLVNAEVNRELRPSRDVLPWNDWGSEKNIIALLLQELPVGHDPFRSGVRMENTVIDAFEIVPGHVSVAVEKLQADEVVCVRFVRDGHQTGDVGKPPCHNDFVLRKFRGLRDRRDEARQVADVQDPEAIEVNHHHPGRVRDLQTMNEVGLASAALEEGRMFEETVFQVLDLLLVRDGDA